MKTTATERGVERLPEDPLLERARELLGVTYLFPYQRLVVANTIDAHEAAERGTPEASELSRQIVVLPTGSGKTLCFLLPAMLLPGVTIVVYPLLALMEDQRRRAHQAGIPAEILKGGMTNDERERLFTRLSSGECRMLITNPEMLRLPKLQGQLSRLPISHLVVDEAHCVSEWGLSFRPSYLDLAQAIEALNPTVTTAFTATASDVVLREVSNALFSDAPTRLVRADPDRPNISYSVLPVHSKELALRSLFACRKPLATPAIVFCRSRVRTESYARKLARFLPFHRVAAYHAGLDRQERSQIEAWFFDADEAVLVATCAYGMGVDKADVRTVVHVDLPPSVEAFLQESGRAGRDRAPASSVFLCSPRDIGSVTGERQELVLGYLSSAGCRREYLMRVMGSTSESCFGCDSCTPEALPHALSECARVDTSAAGQIERLVARNPRRYRDTHLIAMLPGSKSENEELVSSLRSTGRLEITRWGPWSGTLALDRQVPPSTTPSV
jgi:ATP-dependent DNA helicase RecQ